MQSPIVQQVFKYGIINSILDTTIPRGASSNSKNWITNGDQIELSRGSTRINITDLGSGEVSGSIVAKRTDGTEVLFISSGRKVKYFNDDTEEFVEIGSDVLPSGSENEKITFESITTPTGVQVWLNSPSAGLHKIMVANPGSITAMYDGTKNYRGYIAIRGSAIWLWNAKIDNKIPDLVNIYRSKLANQEASDFTQIVAEAIGASGSLTYTGTLAFKAAGAKRTCFEVTFTDGVETFVDDQNGVLVGSAGGTGTINYTTGDYSITFNVVAAAPVTSTYRWEDSTSGGIADFTYSGTRVSGEGFILNQGDGGSPIKNVKMYANKFYVLHKDLTWVVSLSADDLTIDNQIYRNKVGISSIFGSCDTAGGIYYIDNIDENDPQVRKLAFDYAGVEVVSTTISKPFKINGIRAGIDLSDYNFDDCVFREFGDLILVGCKKITSTENDTIIVINKDSNTIDVRGEYYANTIDIYNGSAIVGESISNNVVTIFSGYDDQEADIDNFWEGSLDDFGTERLKKINNLVLEGNIGPDQKIRVYIADDYGSFTEILDNDGGAFIDGQGTYIDRTQKVTIGSLTLGRGEIGGGGDGVEAYHYEREVKLKLDKFQKRKIRFKTEGLGWASIQKLVWKDLRIKWLKLPAKYRSSSSV